MADGLAAGIARGLGMGVDLGQALTAGKRRQQELEAQQRFELEQLAKREEIKRQQEEQETRSFLQDLGALGYELPGGLKTQKGAQQYLSKEKQEQELQQQQAKLEKEAKLYELQGLSPEEAILAAQTGLGKTLLSDLTSKRKEALQEKRYQESLGIQKERLGIAKQNAARRRSGGGSSSYGTGSFIDPETGEPAEYYLDKQGRPSKKVLQKVGELPAQPQMTPEEAFQQFLQMKKGK